MANTVVGLKNVNFLTEEQFNTTTFDNTQMYAVETAPPLTEKQITNCLTENPELVKLSLSGGTLTLEAGSTVIVPYGKSAPTMAIGDSLNGGTISDISWDGTLLFYYVRYDNAKTFVSYYNGSSFCYLTNDGDTNTLGSLSLMHSGTIAPTTTRYMLWYDTNNNIVKYTGDTGSTWTNYQSLVFAIASGTGGASFSAWTSIEQTFQSIGYIGSTVWVGKGVELLVPNGRNTDGSLNNDVYKTDKIFTETKTVSSPAKLVLGQSVFNTYVIANYDKESNYLKGTAGVLNGAVVATFSRGTDGFISYFNPKTIFHALDYNENIISWLSPDMTAGVSKMTSGWRAPTNGWFYWRASGSSAKCYVNGVIVAQGGNYYDEPDTFQFVPVGATVTFTGASACTFYPCIGG